MIEKAYGHVISMFLYCINFFLCVRFPAAIDSKPPKSMVTSVKKRDQMRREAMAKQMKLFDFEKEMKHGSGGASRQVKFCSRIK